MFFNIFFLCRTVKLIKSDQIDKKYADNHTNKIKSHTKIGRFRSECIG